MKIRSGFTLIELLVVISIIGLLASVVLVALNSARVKARDVKRIADLNQLSKALQMYFNDHDSYPPNFVGFDEVCDRDHNVNLYDQMIQTYLINEGYIASIPRSPSGSPTGYCYYNYGPNNYTGSLLVTRLENINYTTIPPFGSCRPFSNTNWCSSAVATKYFCLCHPH